MEVVVYRGHMEGQQTKKEEREIFDLFRIGVIIKGVQAVIEVIASAFIFFVPLHAITRLADKFTEVELAKDPDDFIANHLAGFAHNISLGMKDFAAVYLLLNGLIKLVLVIALLSGKRWAYPVALIALGGFILYLVYRIYLHHSPLLAIATLLDVVIFYFIWHAYALVRKKEAV